MTYSQKCQASLNKVKDLPPSFVTGALTDHVTKLDVLAGQCSKLSHSLSSMLATLREWNASNATLTQSINTRDGSLNAINSLTSSDKFMIENRISKCKVRDQSVCLSVCLPVSQSVS